MPLYEYRCRTCDETFERRRPMSEASQVAECPSGHLDSMRLLSMLPAWVRAAGRRPPQRRAPLAAVAAAVPRAAVITEQLTELRSHRRAEHRQLCTDVGSGTLLAP
jgi:putative FmdB family regulatory protein